jgi:hypothetical protein
VNRAATLGSWQEIVMGKKKATKKKAGTAANLGFEATAPVMPITNRLDRKL